MPLFKRRNPSSVMGLTLQGGRIEGVVLRRAIGALQVQRTFNAPLSLDPLTNDPELVGREIRNHLNAAGVRERQCVVSVPLNWALTLQTKLPDLPEADMSSFLGIQAEKGFPYAPEDLSISISRYASPNGEKHATLVAIPKNHLVLLEKALKAAQLKPVSFSLGIAALRDVKEEPSVGALALVIGENSIDLQVTSGGGVVVLRSLEGALETEGSERRIDADIIAREIKITLGQLPKELRETVTRLRVFGRPEATQPLVNEIKSRVAGMGLQVEPGSFRPPSGFALPLPPDKSISTTLCMAVRYIAGKPSEFEFLPPKVSAWPQLAARISTGKLLWVGAPAGAAALLVTGAFLWQHWTLSNLESKWRVPDTQGRTMEARVREVEDLQQQIRKFRPWFDESMRTLTILRTLTQAFPEDGAVFAKTLEIKDLSTVTCSGVARDNQAFLKMKDRLMAEKGIADLQTDSTRGKSPVQFSFHFRWAERASYEN
jgi:hypothetical protein